MFPSGSRSESGPACRLFRNIPAVFCEVDAPGPEQLGPLWDQNPAVGQRPPLRSSIPSEFPHRLRLPGPPEIEAGVAAWAHFGIQKSEESAASAGGADLVRAALRRWPETQMTGLQYAAELKLTTFPRWPTTVRFRPGNSTAGRRSWAKTKVEAGPGQTGRSPPGKPRRFNTVTPCNIPETALPLHTQSSENPYKSDVSKPGYPLTLAIPKGKHQYRLRSPEGASKPSLITRQATFSKASFLLYREGDKQTSRGICSNWRLIMSTHIVSVQVADGGPMEDGQKGVKRPRGWRSSAPMAKSLLFLLLAFWLAPGGYLRAQVDQATITGTVQDTTGAVIPNALVTLTSIDTGLVLREKTDQGGLYTFSPIKIGHYSVSATAPGFASTLQENLQVNIGARLNVVLTLKPATATERVTVTTAPPMLQTEQSSVNQVVSSNTINSLPLNGRNWVYLAQLTAGTAPSINGLSRGTADFFANGQRATQNNFILDGVDNNVNVIDFMNGASYKIGRAH